MSGDIRLRQPEPGGLLSYRTYRESITHTLEDVLPVEKTDAALLFLVPLPPPALSSHLVKRAGAQVGEEDSCSPTDASSAEMMERLRRAGKGGQGERIVFPKAGHLLEPPYIPHCHQSWHNVLGTSASLLPPPVPD